MGPAAIEPRLAAIRGLTIFSSRSLITTGDHVAGHVVPAEKGLDVLFADPGQRRLVAEQRRAVGAGAEKHSAPGSCA